MKLKKRSAERRAKKRFLADYRRSFQTGFSGWDKALRKIWKIFTFFLISVSLSASLNCLIYGSYPRRTILEEKISAKKVFCVVALCHLPDGDDAGDGLCGTR